MLQPKCHPLFGRQTFSQATLAPAIKDKIEENEMHVVVFIAVPSIPRKHPKKPAMELLSGQKYDKLTF
jgi:hypothetical protein